MTRRVQPRWRRHVVEWVLIPLASVPVIGFARWAQNRANSAVRALERIASSQAQIANYAVYGRN